jgi:hypothetical protein
MRAGAGAPPGVGCVRLAREITSPTTTNVAPATRARSCAGARSPHVPRFADWVVVLVAVSFSCAGAEGRCPRDAARLIRHRGSSGLLLLIGARRAAALVRSA